MQKIGCWIVIFTTLTRVNQNTERRGATVNAFFNSLYDVIEEELETEHRYFATHTVTV